jgi:CheY-like chemotaxis protein
VVSSPVPPPCTEEKSALLAAKQEIEDEMDTHQSEASADAPSGMERKRRLSTSSTEEEEPMPKKRDVVRHPKLQQITTESRSSSSSQSSGSSGSSSSGVHHHRSEQRKRHHHDLLEGVSILIVDDNSLVRKAISGMLSRQMCECQLAEDGRQALEMMEKRQFNCVLMDCLMPVMNGYDAVRELRKRGDSTPVVAITGNSLAEDIKSCRAVGFSDVMVKPVVKRDIVKKILYWKSRRHGDEFPGDDSS